MAKEMRKPQRRGNAVTSIGIGLAVIILVSLYANGTFDVPQTLNQTDDMSVVNAGMAGGERSPYQPISNQLWLFNETGLIRYAEGGVTVAPDNDLFMGLEAGTVTDPSLVSIAPAAYEQPADGKIRLDQLLPTRDWVVTGTVEAVLYGTLDGPKRVVSMKITPLGKPEIIPVPEG